MAPPTLCALPLAAAVGTAKTMAGPTEVLSLRQRATPPFNDQPPRRRDSLGGAVALGERRTLAPGMEDEATRYPGTVFDSGIWRDKTPWYPVDNLPRVGDSWVNWTAAGPERPELHQRNVTVRTMAGTSNTRNLPNPLDRRVGLHTDPKTPSLAVVERYANGNPRMQQPRQDRLLSGQYQGQSYSQTTRLQGA